MPALKNTRVCPRRNFSLSSLTMSMTAWAADGDTSKDTIALVLVHDQARFHTTGLLVGVGHHTTDEVGVSLVEDTHEVVQLALEVGRHSLATLALL